MSSFVDLHSKFQIIILDKGSCFTGKKHTNFVFNLEWGNQTYAFPTRLDTTDDGLWICAVARSQCRKATVAQSMKYCLTISATHRAWSSIVLRALKTCFHRNLRKDFFKWLIINKGEGVLKINEYLLMAIITENGGAYF